MLGKNKKQKRKDKKKRRNNHIAILDRKYVEIEQQKERARAAMNALSRLESLSKNPFAAILE